MILNYENLNEEGLTEISKKGVSINVFKQKEFNKYRKKCEEQNIVISVLRNTKLKEVSVNDESDEYVKIGEKCFSLKSEKSKKAFGYFSVGNNCFVRIEKNSFFPLLLVLLAILIFLFINSHSSFLPWNHMQLEKNDTDTSNIVVNEDLQEQTTFMGYTSATARPGASVLQLVNPEGNTSNFVYLITEKQKLEKIKTFSSENEASGWITEHQNTYTNCYDNSGDYKIKDQEGNRTDKYTDYSIKQMNGSFVVYKNTSDVIYFTKGIAPGNTKNWDICKFLSPGEHNVVFRITPYDEKTGGVCQGANMDVNILVETE